MQRTIVPYLGYTACTEPSPSQVGDSMTTNHALHLPLSPYHRALSTSSPTLCLTAPSWIFASY